MHGDLLKKLGFTEKEAEIYLAVLKSGKLTHAAVASMINVNRSTVYSVVKTLVKKGVIWEDLAGKTTYLVAQPPEEMMRLVRREKAKLKEKEELVHKVIAELSALPDQTNSSIPQIRFVEERDLREFLYTRLPIWNESTKKIDGICWGFQDHTLVEKNRDWINYFWDQAGSDISVKLLTNKSPIEKSLEGTHRGREIKFLSHSAAFTATTWVTGEYLIMITTKQHPHYLVETKDAVLAHNMREVFKNLWDKTE